MGEEFTRFANLGGLGILAYVLWSASRYLAGELQRMLVRQEEMHRRTQDILLRTISANTEALTQMREMLSMILMESREAREQFSEKDRP